MARDMAQFVGFVEPPADVTGNTWMRRMEALVSRFPDQWAKYGPFASTKTAQNKASKLRLDFERSEFPKYGWCLDVEAHEEEDGAFIYIRAWKPGDEDGE